MLILGIISSLKKKKKREKKPTKLLPTKN